MVNMLVRRKQAFGWSKKLAILIAAVVMVALFIGGSPVSAVETPPAEEPVENDPVNVLVTGVALAFETLTLTVGEDPVTVIATVAPENATNQAVVWQVSDENVVLIDYDGNQCLVTPVDVGTATVIVSTVDGEFQAECVVTVNEAIIEEDEEQNDGSAPQVSGLRLNKEALMLKAGRTGTLVAMITPSSASPLKRELVWTTSDPAVAVVNRVGVACKVTAVGVGTATVTVMSPDGTVNAICPVEVTGTAGEVLPPEEEGVSEDPAEPGDDPGTKEFPERTGVDPQKMWTIRFNGPVDVSGISTDRDITVRNARGKCVAVTLQPGDDGNALQVLPPENGYLPGTYTLRVKNLKNSAGKLLQRPVKIRFTVVEQAMIEAIN